MALYTHCSSPSAKLTAIAVFFTTHKSVYILHSVTEISKLCFLQVLGSLKQLFRLRPPVSAAVPACAVFREARRESNTAGLGHSHQQGEVLFGVGSTTDQTSRALHLTLPATVT